jgi:hypothetical protein
MRPRNVLNGDDAIGAWLEDFVNPGLNCANRNRLRLERITRRPTAIGREPLDPTNGKGLRGGGKSELVFEPSNAVAGFVGGKIAVCRAISVESARVGWNRGYGVGDEHLRGVLI